MNPHFFTAPFFFAFIWFRVQVAASLPFLEDGILVSSAFPSWGRLTIREERSPQSFGHFSPLRTR